MVAIKTAQIKSLLQDPPGSCQAFLVYGPDSGMAMEYALALVKNITEKTGFSSEYISLGENDFIDQPDRLNIEAKTLSLFGDRKIIRCRMNKHIKFSLLQELIKEKFEATLIIEAGNLKKTDKLVKLFTAPKNTIAISCYADNTYNISSLVDEILSLSHCTIRQDNQHYLVSILGNDRAVSRSELDKLVLYTGKNTEITSEHITAILGDSSRLVMDDISFALASGQFKQSQKLFDKIIASGVANSTILIAINRHFLRLHNVLAKREKNTTLENAIRTLRPSVHFMKKSEFEKQCKKWTLEHLNLALYAIQSCTKKNRQSTLIEKSRLEQLFIQLCRLSQ